MNGRWDLKPALRPMSIINKNEWQEIQATKHLNMKIPKQQVAAFFKKKQNVDAYMRNVDIKHFWSV